MTSDVAGRGLCPVAPMGPGVGWRERAEQPRADGRGGADRSADTTIRSARGSTSTSYVWRRCPARVIRSQQENWAEAMGQRRRVGNWVAFFRRAVREAALAGGAGRLVAATAARPSPQRRDARADPNRARGPHGLRRRHLAAVRSTRSPTGWGYWAARAIFVPGLAAPAGHLEAAAALAGLPRLAEQRGQIRERFARLGDLAAWTPALTTLRAPGTAEDRRPRW